MSRYRPTLTILVHPDMVIERGLFAAQKYFEKLKQNLSGHVFTHFGYSDEFSTTLRGWESTFSSDHRIPDLLDELRAFVREKSAVARFDEPKYSTTFTVETPDWIIENKGGLIVLAGGREDNCVRLTIEKLLYELGDIIEMQGTEVVVSPNLCYK